MTRSGSRPARSPGPDREAVHLGRRSWSSRLDPRRELAARIPLRVFRSPPWARQRPTWRDADPAVIDAAYRRAAARPGGDWHVVAASREVTASRPLGRLVTAGGGPGDRPTEVVLWRDTDGAVHAGPGACPHLGAPLARGVVEGGRLFCRWHGLALGGERIGSWCPLPAHDDGVLVWVRLEPDGAAAGPPGDRPPVPCRPTGVVLDAVAVMTGRCLPRDILANRLDPWHGAWFHPYSFANLRVVDAPPPDPELPEERDLFTVEVTFRVLGRIGVPVLATFSCPGPRTVVMRIVDGEGAGSVVETHATRLGPGLDGAPRTVMTEAVLATSERPGFALLTRGASVLRPVVAGTARRLWRDDMAYAERRYRLLGP